jgi:hypothetical protein
MQIEFQGRYDIQSLSGWFMPMESRGRSGDMNVSLVDLDGNVVAGHVAGPLVAASLVTVSTCEGNYMSIKSNGIFKG